MRTQRKGPSKTSERTYEDKKAEGQSSETRMAVIENELEHITEKINNDLVTKTDIANLKLWIYGVIGSGVAVVVSFLLVLYRVLYTN